MGVPGLAQQAPHIANQGRLTLPSWGQGSKAAATPEVTPCLPPQQMPLPVTGGVCGTPPPSLGEGWLTV